MCVGGGGSREWRQRIPCKKTGKICISSINPTSLTSHTPLGEKKAITIQVLLTPSYNILGSMLEYFCGTGEQLSHFQGFGKHEQNNFKEQRKIFSWSWGDLGIIFREQGSSDPAWGPTVSILKANQDAEIYFCLLFPYTFSICHSNVIQRKRSRFTNAYDRPC